MLIMGCSVLQDYGKESQAKDVIEEYFKCKKWKINFEPDKSVCVWCVSLMGLWNNSLDCKV